MVKILVAVACAALSVALFLGSLLLTQYVDMDKTAMATICSAAALSLSAIAVPVVAFLLNRRSMQEPWLVTFRELHKEFWNDGEMARVRSWLCCDEAYHNELQPVLMKRLSGQVSAVEYATLEALDRFCALMLRVVHMQTATMSSQQKHIFKMLNYSWWLHRVRHRIEVSQYIKITAEPLYDHVLGVSQDRFWPSRPTFGADRVAPLPAQGFPLDLKEG